MNVRICADPCARSPGWALRTMSNVTGRASTGIRNDKIIPPLQPEKAFVPDLSSNAVSKAAQKLFLKFLYTPSFTHMPLSSLRDVNIWLNFLDCLECLSQN